MSDVDSRWRSARNGVDPIGRARPRRRSWPWWVAAVVALVAAAIVTTEPWTAGRPPAANPSTGPHASVSSTPSPTAVAGTRPRPPVFDATTLATLFVSADDLIGALPAAAPRLVPVATTGPAVWGLPEGSTIEPATCSIVRTVVDRPPAAFDQRSWAGTSVAFVQRVTVLPDVPSAETAFGGLVTAVDACATYTEVNPGLGSSTTIASPATEAQGAYPSLVQRAEVKTGGSVEPELRGHMLIGNAIVSWTASALASAGSPADAGVLGSGVQIDAMIQDVAARAVSALQPTTPAA